MVDIIKKGELPQEKSYTITCPKCKTYFRFKAREAEMISDALDGDYLTIKCPLEGCNSQVTVAKSRYDRPVPKASYYWDR